MRTELFTSVLLVVIELLILATVALVLWSSYKSAKLRREARKGQVANPTVKIVVGVVAALWLAYVVVELLLTAQPMMINGKLYDDSLWIHLSDIVLNTAIIMFLIAAGTIAYGYLNTYRLRKVKEK
jgi:hypothetical protein